MDNHGFLKIYRSLALAAGMLLATCAVASPTADTQTFRDALEAGRANQPAALAQGRQALGPDHPLDAYLEFHTVRMSLGTAPVETVMDFLRRHAQSPLSDDMRALAMAHYGAHQQWSALRAISQGVPGDLRLRCYYYRAMLDGEPERALAEARTLWLAGRSRPESCDPLFDALRDAGTLDDELVWQRMVLAFAEDSPGLMRYLRSQLGDTALRQQAEQLLRLYQQPRQARLLENTGRNGDVIVPALRRLAYKDPVYTRKLLPLMRKRFALTDDAYNRIAARVAWYSVIRDEADNQAWLDEWLADNGSLRLLEQRVRSAIRQQQWPAVSRWIARLPEQERASARWQYWLARALDEQSLGAQAQAHFRAAASQRSFWGFLAAERLGLPLPLNLEPVPQTLPALDGHSQQVATRVALLIDAGEPGLARDEWWWLLRHGDEVSLDALAQLALEKQWPHLAVETALFAGRRNVLDWRFPPAFQQDFEAAASEHGLDPWLLMALSRRESAFNPGARSSAGARGLMQLMPATARLVARDLGLDTPQATDLYQPDLNITLGSNYLAELLARYQGNRILALAAYNAGPHRVDRWLAENPVPHDVFIESIPFHETREYVQAVLAYRVLLARHDTHVAQVATLNARERGEAPYSRLVLADNREP